jgi:hypothetical protein
MWPGVGFPCGDVKPRPFRRHLPPKGRAPEVILVPHARAAPMGHPARSRRRHRSRSGAAGSLDEPMMLSRATAPTRFRHVANEDRILDDAWRVLRAS